MKNLKYNPDSGFSLIEVVVAILMIFFFTNVALNMFVISGLFKKKAVQYTNAINLIQKDIENIKSAADTYSLTTALQNTSCNPASSSSGMATNFMNSLSATTGSYIVNSTTYGAVGTATQVNSTGTYYWLLRKQTVPSAATDTPYSILQLKYVVQPGTRSAPTTTATTLATAYTEVIPYASLQCPSQ
jgi:type II secretory pathway pseudopilin PulG